MQHMGQWNNGMNVLQGVNSLPKKGLIFYVELILTFSKNYRLPVSFVFLLLCITK